MYAGSICLYISGSVGFDGLIDSCAILHLECSGAVATPVDLIDALTQHGKEAGLKDVKICHLHTEVCDMIALPQT